MKDRRNVLAVTGVIAIVKDTHGIAECLAARLQQRGYGVEICDAHTVPEQTGALIFLPGLNQYTDSAQASATNLMAFHAVKRIASHFTENGGVFITAQDTGGRFATTTINTAQAWIGGLPGLVKTAALEWSDAQCKAIDIQCEQRDKSAIADALYEEIFLGGFETEVGLLANGQRVTTAVVEQNRLDVNKLQMQDDDVIIISGGARGVTTTCLFELCRHAKPRLVLLGRSTLDDIPACCAGLSEEKELRTALLNDYRQRQAKFTPADINRAATKIMQRIAIKANLDQFQQMGISVSYYAVDITDVNALEKVLNQVRQQYGKITGIIHGAGVLQDKLIAQKSEEQFNLVFNTKVIGLQNLLAKTKDDSIRYIGLFSSVAGRYGNFGQCDYAMANEVLNKVAQQEQLRRGNDCVVKAYNWGPWDAGMVSDALKKIFSERGIALLSSEDGAQLFVEELTEISAGHVEMILGGGEANLEGSQPDVNVASAKQQSYAVTVDKKHYEFLTDHKINGVAVVPVALALEWFNQAAKHYYPDLHVANITTVKVLQPLKLNKFPKKPYHFDIKIEKQLNQNPLQYQLVLIDKKDTRYYSATVQMQTDVLVARPFVANTEKLPAWDLAKEQWYQANSDVALFHGKSLQVIQSLDGVNEQGGVAKINVNSTVAAIDGAFQLLVLWGSKHFGKITLPLGVGAVKTYISEPIKGELSCYFTARKNNQMTAQHDVFLLDQNNQLVAELRGVTMCLVPELSHV